MVSGDKGVRIQGYGRHEAWSMIRPQTADGRPRKTERKNEERKAVEGKMKKEKNTHWGKGPFNTSALLPFCRLPNAAYTIMFSPIESYWSHKLSI